MSEPLPTSVPLRLAWMNDLASVPQPVNQFVVQVGPSVGDGSGGADMVYLQLGHVRPPFVLPGDDAERALREFAENNVLPVAPLGNFVFSVPRLRELQRAIETTLAQIDEQADRA